MTITKFPMYKLPDIPACLRKLADDIEGGNESAARAVIVLEQSDGAVTYKVFGLEPFPQAHAVGLCFSAAQDILKSLPRAERK